MSLPRRDSKWWGWGDPAIEPELDAEALAALRERDRRAGALPRGRVGSSEFELPDRRAAARRAGRRRSARSASSPRPRTGCATPPAAATPTWPGCAAGGSRRRPTPSCCPADADAAAARARGLRRGGRRRRPLRRRHQRRRRGRAAARRPRAPDQPRPGAPARGRGRPPLADRPPRRRPARARGRGGAGRAQGLTLGHFPQSFEYATIGGFAATRSAGQASSGYGRFDALVSSVRLIAPAGRAAHAGDARTPPPARRCASWSSAPRASLGVIPEVTVRVRPAPAVRRYEAWIAESFEAGAEIVRALAQGPGLPDVIRVSDEEETAGLAGALGPARRSPARSSSGYLGLRRRRGGCLIDRRPRGRARSRSPAAGRSRCASCAPAAPPTSARRPGAPGSTAATRAPTCATR